MTATKGGRIVEDEFDKDGGTQWLVVREKTRGGTVIRTNRYLASEVVAIQNEPADDV